MARRLTFEGVKVEAVVELMPYPGGLTRNLVQCLEDFRIPLYLGHTVTEIRGRDRVEGVTVARVAEGDAQGEDRFDIACDTLVLSVGLLPEIELARMAGCVIDPLTGGPIVDGLRQTSIEGIFCCGNVLHVHDLADEASVEGELAGKAAAAYVLHRETAAARVPVVIEGNLRSVVPQHIDPHRDNLLYLRVKHPDERADLRIGTVLAKRYRRVKPAESITLALPAGRYQPDANGRLRVSLMPGQKTARGVQPVEPARASGTPANLTCIVCPQGCTLQAVIAGGGLAVQGAGCARGQEYARREVLSPVRMVTTTVAVEGRRELLPVRSADPIPKNSLARAIEELRRMTVVVPVKMGQVIVADLAGTGVPAIASKSMV